MKTLIVGMGEVGKALHKVLAPHYDVHTKDLEDKPISAGIGIMHICIRYSDKFLDTVQDYIEKHRPKIVDVCTTVPPGTTAKIRWSASVHSTSRGLHPDLDSGLRSICKHIGGPVSETVADYFRVAGVNCATHTLAKTTEVAHLLNNAAYGASLMLADEMATICRRFGVDYTEAVMNYTATNNEGFRRLDHPGKCRMVLTPPNGRIGGHCVVQSAQMLLPFFNEAGSVPTIARLARYND